MDSEENVSKTMLDSVEYSVFQIPWGHHRYIIDKCKKNKEKALFFVHKTIENNWSRAVLLNFLDTDLFEREGRAITNFQNTLPNIQSDLAQSITKDPYNFDFLTLTQRYDEKELKDALMDNIQKFLLELGNGFAFVGREVRIQVGQKEKYIEYELSKLVPEDFKGSLPSIEEIEAELADINTAKADK